MAWRATLWFPHCLLAMVLMLGAGPLIGQSLDQKQAQAQKERAELQQRIKQLQQHIDKTQSNKKDAALALRDVESRISTTDRRLTELAQEQKEQQVHIHRLDKQIAHQEQQQQQRQQQLAKQLRAQYASGLSPWTALLSGKNPQQIQRDLGYLGYVSKTHAELVRAVEQGLKRLERLHADHRRIQQQLAQVKDDTQQQKATLSTQQTERQQVLADIEEQLKTQQQQAQTLQKNDQRLGELITGLEKEIAHQAELQRQAEEKQRQAQHVAKQAAADATEKGVFHKGMAPPAKGEVQGQFGAQRPDGGPWRGVIFRAAEGTPVKVVAAGQVVFASWMEGFGNLIIVDHGNDYLSVYGHNQSTLKQVGDQVNAGDVIAKVGATGGQVEAGVYFEIRHEGKPVNPQLWLSY